MAKLGGASIEFLRVLRRVAYLLLPHRPSNIYTVFLEIKLLALFFQRNCRWRICIWTMMSISRSFTICNMGKMQNFWDSTNGKWNEGGALWGLRDCQNLILTISHCCFAENGTSSYLIWVRAACATRIFSPYICFMNFHCRCCSLTQSYTEHRGLTSFIGV